MLRLRLAFARGDWSLKMAAGLWAGATIERERKRGANNVRRAQRSLARGRVPDDAPEKAVTNVAAFLLHHSLRDGLALRASARVRLAGTGR